MTGRARTLKDLAERLDVSVATVSRALAGHERIALKTRERVVEAARRFGYVPNHAARALVLGRSGFVGLVLPIRSHGLVDPFLGEFLTGLGAGLARHGTDLFLSAVPEGQEEIAVIRSLVEGRRADGLVLARTTGTDPRVRYLIGQGFPFVTHGRTLDGLAHNWIDTDGAAAFAEAFEMLYALGHRRFGLLTLTEPMTFRHVREEGLRRAIAARGDPDVALQVAASPRFDAAARGAAVRALLDPPGGGTRPTAVIGVMDGLALAAIACAAQLGLAVPRDVSIVGFDNIAAAEHTLPGLTTFDAKISDCAAEAASLLVQVMAEPPAEPVQRLMRPRLVARGSHGPVPPC